MWGAPRNWGVVFAIEDKYHYGTPPDSDISDPLEVLAWRMFWDYSGDRMRGGRVDLYWEFVQDYRISGMVTHQSRSCLATTIGQLHAERVVHDRLNLPQLYLQSDLADVRDYSEAQTKMRIGAFMESMEGHKQTMA